MSHDPSIWVAALLTLAVFSFLWRDNPVYRFGEHLLVGVSAGYYVVQYFYSGIVKKLVVPVQQDPATNWPLIFGGVLGLMMFARLFRRLSWAARYPIAFYVAAAAGYFIPSILEANILKQIGGTVTAPAVALGTAGGLGLAVLSSALVVLGVIAVLVYFFFSVEHRGPTGVVSRVGILYLMVGFGASFGYTVMGRITLLLGRFHFLLGDWLGLVG
jgi:hypothetical protein